MIVNEVGNIMYIDGVVLMNNLPTQRFDADLINSFVINTLMYWFYLEDHSAPLEFD